MTETASLGMDAALHVPWKKRKKAAEISVIDPAYPATLHLKNTPGTRQYAAIEHSVYLLCLIHESTLPWACMQYRN